MCVQLFCDQLCLTLCDLMDSTPPGSMDKSTDLSQQEYWSRLPFPPSGNFPNPDMETLSSEAPVLGGGFFTTKPHGKSQSLRKYV